MDSLYSLQKRFSVLARLDRKYFSWANRIRLARFLVRASVKQNLKYLMGINLNELKRQRPKLPDEDARSYFQELAEEAKSGPIFTEEALMAVQQAGDSFPQEKAKALANLISKDENPDLSSLDLVLQWLRVNDPSSDSMTYTQVEEATGYEDNPYHASHLRLESEHELRAHNLLKEVNEVESSHPDNPLKGLCDSYNGNELVRLYACRTYSWAVPNKAAIQLLAKDSVLEVGAGNGYWSRLVSEAGGDIIATDENPVKESFFNLQKMTAAEAVRAMGKGRTLLMVWPPYRDSMALDALNAYREIGGKRLVYVGESKWGCTGSDEFFDALPSEHETLAIPRWLSVNDFFTVYNF